VIEQAAPPLTKDSLADRFCEHCQAFTAQVIDRENTCLQCIADGRDCCRLSMFRRRLPAQAQS
jgi:hypothetical protein